MTDWTKLGIVPKAGMIAWNGYKEGESTNSIASDLSGNGRDLDAVGADPPALQMAVINGQPAWYFNGTDDALLWSGSITTKHLFVLAAFEDASFSDFQGLYSNADQNSGDILVSNPTGTNMFDFSSIITYTYRKNDVSFANNAQAAPMGGQFGLIEVSSATGWAANGIQIGDQQSLGRKFKGWFVESIPYSRVLADFERIAVYEYFAMKFNLWRQVASGLDVWPFQANWAYPFPTDKAVLASRSISGAFKAREKRPAKDAWELSFATRSPEEVDAAKAFWNAKYPGTSFIYRDDAYSPARDTEVLFTSGINRQVNGFRDIDYELRIEEV